MTNVSKHAFEVGKHPSTPPHPASHGHLFDGQALVHWDSEI